MKRMTLLTLLLLGTTACGSAGDPVRDGNTPANADNGSTVATQSNPTNSDASTDPTLTDPTLTDPTTDPVVDAPEDDVVADLVYMRQEEKLARDVYLTLGDVWEARVFNNIANSEQTHMDKVLDLLNARGEEDPVEGLGIGEYQDAEFVALYETLVARGMQSSQAAFQVGVDIENLDIIDLTERIDKNPPEDVATVYDALRSGSYNHLDAFTRQLNR